MLKPWAEHQRIASLQIRLDVLVIDLALDRIGQQDHDDIGFGGGVTVAQDAQPFGFGLGAALASFVQTDAHIDAAVAQIQRMGMALAAIADDCNLLARQQAKVGLVFVIDVCHTVGLPLA